MSERPLLEVRDLTIRYHRRRQTVDAVDEVSLTVGRGETVGLVGESGSGKSTIARSVVGLVPVHHGEIRFEGNDITRLQFEERRQLSRDLQMIFQDPYSSLNPARTIGRTLAEPLEAHGLRDRTTIRTRVSEMLERVHLPPDAADRYPRQFSGGQRQRVAIARALILEPRLVICDEPVSALDLSVQAQILNLLRELQQTAGLSYLFISHDLEVVRHMCDRVVVLYAGRVMEVGGIDRLATRPAHPYTLALRNAAPKLDPREQRLRHSSRLEQATFNPSPGPVTAGEQCRFAPRCRHAQPRCWTERPQLLPSGRHGLVACHRYPEWVTEALSMESAAPRSIHEQVHADDADHIPSTTQ